MSSNRPTATAKAKSRNTSGNVALAKMVKDADGGPNFKNQAQSVIKVSAKTTKPHSNSNGRTPSQKPASKPQKPPVRGSSEYTSSEATKKATNVTTPSRQPAPAPAPAPAAPDASPSVYEFREPQSNSCCCVIL